MRIFKIKKPSLNFQSSLRYELIKENKTTYWLMETESKTLFKGVLKSYVEEILDLPMKKRKIIAEFEINTEASEDQIHSALLKGIAVGLDSRRVCMPREITKFEVKTYIL